MAIVQKKPFRFRFKVIAGTHSEGARIISAGECFDHNFDLRQNFANKFILVNDSEVPEPAVLEAPTAATPATERAEAASKPPEATEAAAGPLGNDVTSRFPKAKDQDYRVYRHEGLYYVYDSDLLTKSINPKGVDKDGVDSLVEKALG